MVGRNSRADFSEQKGLTIALQEEPNIINHFSLANSVFLLEPNTEKSVFKNQRSAHQSKRDFSLFFIKKKSFHKTVLE